MKINLRVTITLFMLMALLGSGLVNPVYAQRQRNLKDLLALQRTTPEKRFEANRAKGDFRFMGLYGFTLDVRGIVGGGSNSIVQLYKIEPVKGTSDMIESEEQERAQNYAYPFVERYNRILMNYLVKAKLSEPKSAAAWQIRFLEIADAKADAQAAIKTRDFRFLSVQELPLRPVGVPYVDLKSVEKYKIRVINPIIEEAKELEAKRLKSIARSYGADYNHELLNYLVK